MNSRQLNLIIRAQNQTKGAFNDVSRQFYSIYGQINIFNRRAITFPRVIAAMFLGVGTAIQHTLGLVDKGFNSLAVLQRIRSQQLLRQAEDLKRRAALAPTYAQMNQLAMQRNQVLKRAGQSTANAENLEVLGSIIGGIGRLLTPIMGIAGSVIGILFRGFTAVVGLAWDLVKVVGGALWSAVKAVSGVVGELGQKLVEAGVDFASKGIDFNSFKEQTLIAFEIIFKSIDTAQQKFAFLKRFADITPFDLKETINAGKMLAAYGLDVERFMRIAGNMSSAFNKPLEQAVELLGRAKAGIYSSRTFAPFGLTRDRLKSVGIDFTKAGSPVNRDDLLGGVERAVSRDFGGMMERQSRSAAGLQERLRSFWTESFPGMVTTGLFTAYKAILDFLGKFIDAAQRAGTLDRVGHAIGMVFDTVGAVLYKLVQFLPSVVNWFDQIVQTGKWRKFLEVIYQIGSKAWELLVTGAKYVYDNWGTIWPATVAIFIDAIKLIGGLIAGIINVFYEWLGQGKSTQDMFRFIGDAIRGFSLVAVNGITKVVAAMFLVQAAIGLIVFGIGALAGSLPVMLQGLIGLTTGLAGAFATLGIGDWMKKSIANFDASKFFPDMGTLAQRKDAIGSFARGYVQFGETVDKVFKSLSGKALPGLPDFPNNAATSGGAGITDPDLQAKAAAAAAANVKSLKEESEAWKAIVEATKAYTEILSDPSEALNLQFQALMGQLGALNHLKDAYMQYFQYLDFGTKEWWEAMKGVNETAKAVNEVRDEVRKLIFDVQKLEAATDFQEKMFKIGKEIGLSGAEMQQIAATQFQLLTSTLMVERARLSTLNEGTLEWYKQRVTILDIIGKIVALKKELGETNLKIAQPKLMSPRTPYGMRGAAFGPELTKSMGAGQGAQSIMDLIQFALNPKKQNLDIMAKSIFPGAIPGNMAGLDKVLTPAQDNANAMAPLFGGVTSRLDQIKSVLLGNPTGSKGGFAAPESTLMSGGTFSGSVTWSETTKKLVELAASFDDLQAAGFKIPSGLTTTQRRTDILPDVNIDRSGGGPARVSGITPGMMRQYGIGMPDTPMSMNQFAASQGHRGGMFSSPDYTSYYNSFPQISWAGSSPFYGNSMTSQSGGGMPLLSNSARARMGFGISGGGVGGPGGGWGSPWNSGLGQGVMGGAGGFGVLGSDMMPPPHQLYNNHIPSGSSVTTVPNIQAPPQVGPWDFWGPSLRRNAAFGYPQPTPGTPYHDNSAYQQWQGANVRTATPPPVSTQTNSIPGINLSIPITINGEVDEQRLRQLATQAFEDKFGEVLSEIRRRKSQRSGD